MRGLTAILAGLALSTLLASPGFAKSDKDFLTDALKGDNSEVALGKLAVSKGATEQVRAFGKTLMTDHAKARQEAAALAKRLGVTPPSGPTDEAQAEMSKLSAMTGASFDDEFVNYMVQDHQKDISEFEDQAKTGSKGTAALAKATLPTLEKHLKIAQSLVGKG
ncbi:MAG: DUF4142 domain-containing protein [Devosia sp.]|jgi:putative membrane protein